MEGLTTDENYAEAVRDVRLFLEGRQRILATNCAGACGRHPSRCSSKRRPALHDLLHTVEEMGEKQKMAAADGNDTDIFAYYAEPPLVAVNLFHLRGGHIVDRREFFWEDQLEFDPPEFFSSLLKQVYLDDPYIPGVIHVPVEFEDREVLEEFLRERRGRKVEIHTPQRGQKRAMIDLVESNAKHSFEQRFRVMKPTSKAIEGALAGRAGAGRARPGASNVSISRTSRAPTKWPAWWCGKTGG